MPNQLPRQAPSLNGQQQQQQQQVNGVAGAGQAPLLANAPPHAGHQPDINYLWTVVQELSQVLSENRSQTQGIISSVREVQTRAHNGDADPALHELNGQLSDSHAVDIADLHGRLAELSRQRDELQAASGDAHRLVGEYEDIMNMFVGRVRACLAEHTGVLHATHRHYLGLLEAERAANLALRVEHGQWQASLGRAAELARLALRARADEARPYEGRVAELRAENRVLRRLLGWAVDEDSDDDDERRRDDEAAAKGIDLASGAKFYGAGTGA